MKFRGPTVNTSRQKKGVEYQWCPVEDSADNATLIHSHPNFAVLIDTVNSEFQEGTEYFKMHKQALHPDKTKFIVFSHNRDVLANPPNFVINSMTEITISLKEFFQRPISILSPFLLSDFLVFFFNPQLHFKHHIHLLTNKLSRAPYFFVLQKKSNFKCS